MNYLILVLCICLGLSSCGNGLNDEQQTIYELFFEDIEGVKPEYVPAIMKQIKLQCDCLDQLKNEDMESLRVIIKKGLNLSDQIYEALDERKNPTIDTAKVDGIYQELIKSIENYPALAEGFKTKYSSTADCYSEVKLEGEEADLLNRTRSAIDRIAMDKVAEVGLNAAAELVKNPMDDATSFLCKKKDNIEAFVDTLSERYPNSVKLAEDRYLIFKRSRLGF
ncbi:MAG: hypothetical protein MK212_14005 [Saprospiraceae bacterium]|nr:hypothetical protein [Saprospiraceae bacterium]